MAGKTEMTLNPADLKVDDSLPAYPMLQIPKASVSDQDVAAGNPLRIAARQKVLNVFEAMVAEQRLIKNNIEKKWNTLSAEDKKINQKILDMYNKDPIYLALFNYVKQELVWWNNNLELSPRQVNKRDLQYDETILKKQLALENSLISQVANIKQAGQTKEEKEKAAKEALLNRTLYDDVSDSFSILAKWLFTIFYILVGLRCASFAANELLYKPVPYRILAFVYTFIFCPIFAPYYLWKVIQNYIWGTTLPLYEGLLPIIPYDSSDLLTLNRRLFGYANTPFLQEWIKGKQEAELEARNTAVISKNMKAEIIQEHNE
jgi:hypothetical protein